MRNIKIAGREIGPGNAPYVIAEISANHNGSLERALATIRAAADSGADAIKIQTYTADSMTIDCDTADFMIEGGLWDGYKLYELYREASTPYAWHKHMFDAAEQAGIPIFSTPFDEEAVDLLESLGAPAYKIASFEATDLPLIAYVAKKGKPMIISTGMTTVEEIAEAVDTARQSGCQELAVLHCVSSYPASPADYNLATIPDIASRFGVVSGLSDHSLGNAVAVAGVALGASIVEKHFQLDKDEDGPDSAFSIVPNELEDMCSAVGVAAQSVGSPGYRRSDSELQSKRFRRSLYYVQDLKAGQVITADSVRRIRPGFGLPPKYHSGLIGARVTVDVKRGQPVTWDSVDCSPGSRQ